MKNAAAYFDVTGALAAVSDGRPVVFPAMESVFCEIENRPMMFHLNMRKDPIQRNHRDGKFYEDDDLVELSKHIKTGSYVLDVGANIGNHALFFATRMNAARVVVIEPNPKAVAPLMANVLANGLADIIDLSCLGIGLSDHSDAGYGMTERQRNLGAAKLAKGTGTVEVHPGDALFAEDPPDLIKIDVEGMEMKVLAGLAKTIKDRRPAIFIEVDKANDQAFHDWCAENEYSEIFRQQRYAANINYFVTSNECTTTNQRGLS